MLVAAFSASLLVAVISQPPTATPPKASQQSQERVAPDRHSTNRENDQSNSPTITINNQIDTPSATREPASKPAQEKGVSTADWWGAINTALLTLFTGGLFVVTAGLVFVSWLQARILTHHSETFGTMLTTFRTIERAYVVLSHQTRLWGDVPPQPARAIDVRGANAGDTSLRELWFTMEIQNHGSTPAEIIGGGIWFRTAVESYPAQGPTLDVPPHYPVEIAPSFVVPGDHPEITSMIWCPTDTWSRVEQGEQWFWLMGHVDYRDRFGEEHRAGYGRWYDCITHRLVFHRTTGDMNYDKPLTAEDKRRYREALATP